MEPAKFHGSRREKSRKLVKYLQLEEKKSQKKQHLHGEERFGFAETGSSNKPKHSSDSRDRSQPRRGRSGGENLPSHSRYSKGTGDMQKNSVRSKMNSHLMDSSDEEEWKQLNVGNSGENDKIERIVSGRVINQCTPSGSDSGLDSRRLGPRFTHVDVNLEKGMGDEPLPHAVPIVGLRSARTARSATTTENSSKPFSVVSARRSTGASAKASYRSRSAGMSLKNPYHLPTARSSFAVTSTRVTSAVRSRSSSESTDGTLSPRTYNVLSPISRRSNALLQEKTSRTARSSRSVNLPSNTVSPKSGRERGQPPGYWVNICDERGSNLSNLCVWAITDPPPPPPGIVWKKVTPPTSPVLSPKEVGVESEMQEIDEKGKENEAHDAVVDTSIHIVPELTPSLDPSAVVPKTIIRKVMMMPENVGYPGFCEPSEAKVCQRNKKILAKEIVGENKTTVCKSKDTSKSNNRPISCKEQPQKTLAHAHKVTKKNGITPSSWRAGLKCARKELGPWKPKVSTDEDESKGKQENSEAYGKLHDICKFVENTEYKLRKARADVGSSEVHLFHRESGESEKLEMEKCGENIQNKEIVDFVDEPKSLDKRDVKDVPSENKIEIFSKKNSEDILMSNDLAISDNPSRKSPRRKMNKRLPGVKSAHNLNNAFIAGGGVALPKRVNPLFSLTSDSKGVLQSKCTLRHQDPMAIKEYIRIQKKQRHVKLMEEKEKKKMIEENRRAKLLELRSKSRELVELSIKKKDKFVNKELEFLQMYGKQLDELALNVNLKEKSEDVEIVNNNKSTHHNSAEMKSSHCDSLHSKLATNSQNTPTVEIPNRLELFSDFKLDCASIDLVEDCVPPKSVQHVGLQTDEDFFNSLSNCKKNAVVGENINVPHSATKSLCFVESKLPIYEAKVVEAATSFSEKSASSKAGSDEIVIDKDLCHSIQREMKKLSHIVYVLEKHRVSGVLQEKGATSAQRGILTRKSLEAGDILKSDLNNTKISTLGGERLSIIRNDSPLESVFPHQSHMNPLCSTLIPHSIFELPARAKPSANSLIHENQNGYTSLDAGDASINTSKFMLTGKERKTPSKNNISSNLLDIKQNYTLMSDSIISEGPLSEDELANFTRLKEAETNNLQENAQSKNLDERRKDEIPLWLKKPPMESHPFNFISAVKMKLKRFLEEQNKNILTDTSPNAIPIPRPLVFPDDNKEERLGKEPDDLGDEPEANYESDFEQSVASGSGPSQNDEKVSAANSSDLDTATEDILPTDEVPQSKIPSPNDDVRKEPVDYNSDNISEISRKSGSLASNKSHFSNVNHQLMAPNFTLSRLGGTLISINDRDTESKVSTAELENVKERPKSNESEVLSVLSVPSAKLSCDKSSYGSCKTDLSIASKSGLASEDFLSNKTDSKTKILPATITQRKALGEESALEFNEVISSVSTMQMDKFLSDGSHVSSKSHDAASSEIDSACKVRTDYDGRLQSAPPSSFPIHLSSLKELNDKHSQRLTEMEMKAFEHRLEMERAFEKERQKLELALEEARKTVIDSKLEATKFISNAAVELVKSQAEATKANAEATRHISEAKVIDALKLETISAQSASAAAFAAVQAAIKQLQSFKKVKQLSKKNHIPENSFTSTASEADSSTSDRKSVNTSAEGENEQSELVKSIAKESKLIKKAETSEKSITKMETKGDKILDAVPKDSSLNSISENISEPEYSSKFDETVSERELKSAPKLPDGGADIIESYSTTSKVAAEIKKVSANTRKKNEFVIKSCLDTTDETDISLGSPQLDESSNTDHDSFTKFSLSMFQQLMREEEMRAQHQQALLKLREEALIDKTKAEMILLELKKKQYREKGQEDAVSSIRKKQRGLLLRLKLERDEILRLKKSHKTASHERRMMLTQQQHIVRMRISTKEIMNKLQTKKLPHTPKAIRAMGFIGSVLSTSKSNVELNTEESALESVSHSSAVPEEIHSVDVTHSDVSLPTLPLHSSHGSLSDSGSHNGHKKSARRLEKQVVHRLDDLERNKKFLSEREKNLIHRRQAVEELIVWRKRLEQEEERVKALESQALAPSKVQQIIGSIQFSALKADRSTSPLQFEPLVDVKPKEDAATSMADISLTQSSIMEDIPNESQKSSFSAVDEVDAISNKNDFADESLKSSGSASAIKTEVSVAEQSRDSEVGIRKTEVNSNSSKASIPQINDKDESKDSSFNITIKSPLTSYMPGRQKRRHSSGSDESVILSQNETASEQSDVEGKICALQEQLRRRKMEAELLKREQKRCRRERLKAKEQSLIKQIQAYDQYIQKARTELEQECESPTTSLVKPQIKQPRVAEWKKVIDDPRDVLLEASEKADVVDSVEKISSGPQNEVQKQSEKLSPLESIPESAEKGLLSTLEREYSEQVCDSIKLSQIKNDSCSSLSEVLEEIQMPAEELAASDNSQGSISRESSVETTIESPTKQDMVECVRYSDGDNDYQPDKDMSLKNDTVVGDPVSTIIEVKSDKYEEDTFEPTSGSNMKVDEFSFDKMSESLKSPAGQESDEVIEELPSEKHDGFPSGASECEDEMINEENEISGNHFFEEMQVEQALEEVSEDSVTLPSHVLKEDSAPNFNPDETYVVSEENELSMGKAEEITENILRNLLDESVFEAEVLINKNSACTLTIQEFDDKVKELVPLYEVESYEEVLEQKLEDFQPGNEEMVNIVSINSNDFEEVHTEDMEASNVNLHSSQANTVLSDLLQLLLEDATAEMLSILERRESFFRQGRDHDVMVLNECTFQSTTSIGRDSDVIKRVQQIMFESSLSQVSPREKSRPQDLMITTYDVLSPDSSNCSSPVLGQPDMEMVFAQDEKYSPKSPIKYTTGKAIQFLQVEHSAGLGASAGTGESSGAENDAFSQEWFEEDFGINSTLREVEEIQLQRLQIEREIEQLQLAQAKEQQQKQYPYNFYIREIPNKPPPPYTPPEETPRISASLAGPSSPLGSARDTSPKVAVPTDQEEVANFVRTAARKFYDAWSLGERLDSVEPPSCSKLVGEEDDDQNEGIVDGDLRRKSKRSYSQFLFDLSRQLVDEFLDNVEGEKFVSVPTRFGSKKWRPSLPVPSRECFVEEVKKQALVILGFIPRETRDNFMFSWTVKKRDHIEEIIMREMQEEERFWTNFDEEERYIKEQIAESLLELLLVDTTKAVAMTYERRVERLSVDG